MHDHLILAILIIAPALVPTLLTILLSKRGKSWRSATSDVFHLSIDSLFKQRLFWLSVIVPLSYFFVFGFICWSGYTVSISEYGFRTFIRISALPFALLSTAIPLGVTVARFHSTEQTSRQIKQASEKNNLDAFYSHRKEFFAYFDKIPENKFIDTINVKYQISPKLHGRFFSGSAQDGTPKLNRDLIELIIPRLSEARSALIDVISGKDEDFSYERYASAAFNIYWIATQLGAKEIQHDLYRTSYSLCIDPRRFNSEYRIRSLGSTTEEAIAAFRIVKSYLLNILHFAGDPETIAKIHSEEVSFIDISNGFLQANSFKFIEHAFSDASGPLWETLESQKLSWFESSNS